MGGVHLLNLYDQHSLYLSGTFATAVTAMILGVGVLGHSCAELDGSLDQQGGAVQPQRLRCASQYLLVAFSLGFGEITNLKQNNNSMLEYMYGGAVGAMRYVR